MARSSDDFWPTDPASHTTHIAVNAYNSLFMGAILQPDWDMFHSQHPAALLHATARVVCCSLNWTLESRREASRLSSDFQAGKLSQHTRHQKCKKAKRATV